VTHLLPIGRQEVTGCCHRPLKELPKEADEWARAMQRLGRKVEIDARPGDWKRYGRAAGFIRNGEMVAEGADICLAFPYGMSPGTRDCIARAQAAGIPVRIYERQEGAA
jgi:endonuclease YncB( thermonuclease family)